MSDHDIICKYQSGFQPGDSTVKQLVEIYNAIISTLCKGKDVQSIFVTYIVSKAFDKVWHKDVLSNLQNYVISGTVLAWFENVWTDRLQKVVIDDFTFFP